MLVRFFVHVFSVAQHEEPEGLNFVLLLVFVSDSKSSVSQ